MNSLVKKQYSDNIKFLVESLDYVKEFIQWCVTCNNYLSIYSNTPDDKDRLFSLSTIIEKVKAYHKKVNIESFENDVSPMLINIDEKKIYVSDEDKKDLSSTLDNYRMALTKLSEELLKLKRSCLSVYNFEPSFGINVYILWFVPKLRDIIDTRYQFETTTNIDNTTSDDVIPFETTTNIDNTSSDGFIPLSSEQKLAEI